jgi:hypothetical protein
MEFLGIRVSKGLGRIGFDRHAPGVQAALLPYIKVI